MADLTVRPLQAADEAAWQDMWTTYLSAAGTPASSEVVATAFERLMHDDPHEPQCLIALRDGAPVGLAHFLFHRMIWTVEDTCFLMDV